MEHDPHNPNSDLHVQTFVRYFSFPLSSKKIDFQKDFSPPKERSRIRRSPPTPGEVTTKASLRVAAAAAKESTWIRLGAIGSSGRWRLEAKRFEDVLL